MQVQQDMFSVQRAVIELDIIGKLACSLTTIDKKFPGSDPNARRTLFVNDPV